jgi:VWFA-related protein
MRKALHHSVCLTLLLAGIAIIALGQQIAPPASAPDATNSTQTPAQPPTSQPPTNQTGNATVLRVQTRLVVVDVVALDHKGVPVTDLKAEDFTLREENTDQKIRTFSFQQGIQPQAAAATLVAATLPPNRITNMPRFKTNSALNILLLDGINTSNTNQIYMRDQMLRFLEKLPDGQPMAVFALGTKLRLLQDFTTDPALLKRHRQESERKFIGNTRGGFQCRRPSARHDGTDARRYAGVSPSFRPGPGH